MFLARHTSIPRDVISVLYLDIESIRGNEAAQNVGQFGDLCQSLETDRLIDFSTASETKG